MEGNLEELREAIRMSKVIDTETVVLRSAKEGPRINADTTEHSIIAIDKADTLARLNSFLYNTDGNVICYVIVEKTLLVRIQSIRPCGDLWACDMYKPSIPGTCVMAAKGSPILMYIE